MGFLDKEGLEYYNSKVQTKIDAINENVKTLAEHDTTLPMTAVSAGSTEEEINSFYDNYSADIVANFNQTSVYRAVVTHSIAHSVLGGATKLLEGHKTADGWEWQKITSYGGIGTAIFTRCKNDGTWTPWKRVDIGNVLTANKNVYVDATNGDDITGDGTQSKPWKTIQKAVDECPSVSSGSESYNIYLSDGVYDGRVIIYNKTKMSIYGSDTDGGVIIRQGIDITSSDDITLQKHITLGAEDISVTNSYGFLLVAKANVYNVSKLTIVGNVTTPAGCGILIGQGGTIDCTRGNDHLVTIRNCNQAIYSQKTGNGYIGRAVIENSCKYGFYAQDGGQIGFYSQGVTNNAVTPYCTEYGAGRIYTDTQGWQTIGSVTGANSVAIDSNKYTEFEVIQTCSGGSIIHHFSSGFTGDIYDGYYKNSGVNAEASIAVNNTSVRNSILVMNGADRLSETTMTVKGRRV